MANPTAKLTALLQRVTIEDNNEVLETTNAALKVSKNNLDALHAKVVALLKLDRFEDALRTLDEGGDKLENRCVLEKAYALYKTGKLAEAEKLAQAADRRGLKHVAAQIAYRAENFNAAAIHYKDLCSQGSMVEGEENDLRINFLATDAQLEWQGNGDKVEQNRRKPWKEDLDAFEISYNSACGFIARGDLKMASVFLKRARDLCQASNEMSDDEKRAETLPIMVQEAYVLRRLGKLEEAKALHDMINVNEYVTEANPIHPWLTYPCSIPELVTRVIAHNNSLIWKGHINPHMTQLIFDSFPPLTQTEKHFSHQANILQRNKYILSIQILKYPGVAHSTAKILSNLSPTISPHVNLLSVINAAAHAKGEEGKSALKAILPLLNRRPNDVGLIMIVVQLSILNNNPGQAVSSLEAFLRNLEESTVSSKRDIRFAPGLVALLISLYRLTGRKAPIISELSKATSHWRRRNRPCTSLLRAAGISLLESANPEDHSTAGEIFKLLREKDPSDRIAIAGYIASHASNNPSEGVPDIEKLTPITQLISGIDVDMLEKTGVPFPPTPLAPTSKKRSADDKKAPSKKRKLSKKRTPKNYEEGKKVDPERWLPLRDRSTYRLKGKKGKKKGVELTQGGIVSNQDTLVSTLASGPGVVKNEKPSAVKMKKKKGKK